MSDPNAPRPEEHAAATEWWVRHLDDEAAALPFSFAIDGRPADLSAWQWQRQRRRLDDDREELTLTGTHADHGLQVHCTAVRYQAFPALEWVVTLHQAEAGACPVVSNLLGLDARWQREPDNEFILRGHRGDDHEQRNVYEPWTMHMRPGLRREIAPTSRSDNDQEGRCSSGQAFPFFAVDECGFGPYAARPLKRGVLLAVGWPGRWKARFDRIDPDDLRICAGQEHTRLRLRPGESCRAPLIAMLLHTGDRIRAQNLWRRWMIRHNLPRINGELPKPMIEGSTCGFLDEMTRADEANQLEYIARYREAQLPITHWWMDAGWYPCEVEGRRRWPRTGTWEPDRNRFPNGLRSISDHLHARGVRTIVWFEPERIAGGTWLRTQRPQWLIERLDQTVHPPAASEADALRQNHMLDLGHPEALAWLIEHVSRLIESEGIDVYRQDFNFNPLPYWRDNDLPGREGMRENRHCAGYLAYWDALRRRFPHLLLDSCASGGRRNDLETMRRAVALHSTDHRYDDLPVKQAIRHSLFQWLPFFGGPVLPLEKVDAYAFRSTMGLSTCIGFDLRREDLDLDLLRRLMTEWHEVAPLYYGDFYPLTSHCLNDDA